MLLVLGAACSPALDNRPRSTPDAGPEEKPATGEPEFPTADLAAKHDAAKASPQSFDVLHDYARAVADYCLASLLDQSCAPDCPKGLVKYKPASDLDPKNWVLVQNALVLLEPLKEGKGLPPPQFEQFVSVKGRLLGLAGHAVEERALIDGYALAHPDAFPVVKRRLEMLRQSGEAMESESQCRRSRVSMKTAADATRLEVLTTCVALHPGNTEGKADLQDYTKFLPDPAKAEQRLYRKYLVQRCVEDVGGSKEAHCAQACACKDQPDKESKAACKQACRDCRIETAQKIRECKKSGGASAGATKVAPAKPSAKRPKAGEPAPEPGPEMPKTVL